MNKNSLFMSNVQRLLMNKKNTETVIEFVFIVAKEGYVNVESDNVDYDKLKAVFLECLVKVGLTKQDAEEIIVKADTECMKLENIKNTVKENKKKVREEKIVFGYNNMMTEAELIVKSYSFIEDQYGVKYQWNGTSYEVCRKEDMIDAISDKLGSFNVLPAKVRGEYITAMDICSRQLFKTLDKTRINQPLAIFPGLGINIETGEEFKPTPNDFILSCSSFVPVEGNCDRILKMLESWGNKEMLIDILAYTHINSNPLKLIFFCYGAPNTGKSTFSTFNTNILGDSSVGSGNLSLLTDTSQRFELSNLRGKLAVFCSETDGRGIYKTSILKQVSGNDKIRAEYKGVNGIQQFYFHGKIFVLTNDIPQLDDISDKAFMGRVCLVHFGNKFSIEGNNILSSITVEEYQAFAYLMLKRIKEWANNKKIEIRGAGTFDDRITKYALQANPLDSFIKEECDINDKDAKTYSYQFRDAFTTWQKEKNMKVWDELRIGHGLNKLGFKRVRDSVGDRWYYYQGIQIRPSMSQCPSNINSFLHVEKGYDPLGHQDIPGRNDLLVPNHPVVRDVLVKDNPHFNETELDNAILKAKERGDIVEHPSGYYRTLK